MTASTSVARARSALGAAYAPERLGSVWVLAIAIAIAGTAVAALRIEPGTRRQLWAEDGWIFLEEAYAGAAEPWTPYRGYAHLVPRLVASVVVRFVPMQDVGIAMNVAGAAIVGACAAIVLLAAATRMRLGLAVVAAATVVLLPIGSMELAGNVANAHWYLIVAAFWVLVARAGGVAWTIVGASVVVAAAMSDPLTGALLPVAVARLLAPGWRPRIPALAWATSMAAQALVVLGTTREGTSDAMPSLVAIADMYVVRVGFGLVAGGVPGDHVATAIGLWPARVVGAAVLLAVAIGCAIVVRRTAVPATAFLTGAGFFVVVHALTWPKTLSPGFDPVSWAQRYSAVALLLTGAALLLLLDALLTRAGASSTPRWRARTVAVVACAAVLWSSVPAFQSDAPRAPVAPLAPAVDAAVEACEEDPTTPIVLPVDPTLYALDVACDAVLEHARR